MMLGKLQRAHPTFRGPFAPAYLVESNMLRAYLFFIYGCRSSLKLFPKNGTVLLLHQIWDLLLLAYLLYLSDLGPIADYENMIYGSP